MGGKGGKGGNPCHPSGASDSSMISIIEPCRFPPPGVGRKLSESAGKSLKELCVRYWPFHFWGALQIRQGAEGSETPLDDRRRRPTRCGRVTPAVPIPRTTREGASSNTLRLEVMSGKPEFSGAVKKGHRPLAGRRARISGCRKGSKTVPRCPLSVPSPLQETEHQDNLLFLLPYIPNRVRAAVPASGKIAKKRPSVRRRGGRPSRRTGGG